MWKECLQNREYVDCCIIGDGEYPLLNICNGVKLSRIAGVATRDKNGAPTICEPEYHELDEYPDPDWSLIDITKYQTAYRNLYNITNATVGMINSQKGCRWREKTGGCIFCGLVRPFLRTRSPERVWQEIKKLQFSYGFNHFWELSDTICSDINWLTKFNQLKPLGTKLFFRGYARSSEINEETANLLRQIGFREMFIGIESGDDAILKASNKGTTAKINLRATKILSENKIKTFASIVLGLPGESKYTLQKTYDHVLRLFDNGLHTLSVCVFTPYPGSRAFEIVLSNKTFGYKFKNRDVFNWPSFAKVWVNNYCNCSFTEVMSFLDKYSLVPGCLYENNFTYIKKHYDI